MTSSSGAGVFPAFFGRRKDFGDAPAPGRVYDEGECVDGKKAGEWRTYDADGKRVKATVHKPR